jgi:hypothetical protein
MTSDEHLKSVANGQRPSAVTVHQFNPRMRSSKPGVKEPSSAVSRSPEAKIPMGDDDDPGPAAA